MSHNYEFQINLVSRVSHVSALGIFAEGVSGALSLMVYILDWAGDIEGKSFDPQDGEIGTYIAIQAASFSVLVLGSL